MGLRPAGRAVVLALLAGGAVGCQTPVGNFFVNRARDFGECWRAEVAVGTGIGGGVNLVGLAHVGLGGGLTFPSLGLGWRYGSGYLFPDPGGGVLTGDIDAYCGVHGSASQVVFGPCSNVEGEHHTCIGILPALFSHVGKIRGPTIWQAEPTPEIRRARVHVFDVEVSAYALFVGARAGFSPGEFVDFLLGWFGVDIAQDDVALPARPPG